LDLSNTTETDRQPDASNQRNISDVDRNPLPPPPRRHIERNPKKH
jgi:hypothetical protein